jgi:uncharacterized protein (DUF433 family)
MAAATRMLKLTEAAVVADVAVRDVNRAIDEGILAPVFFTTADGRRVAAPACALVAFYFDSADRLTANERLFTIKSLEKPVREWNIDFRVDLSNAPRKRSIEKVVTKYRHVFLTYAREHDETYWRVLHEYLTVDFAPFVTRTADRLAKLAAAREIVVSDPEILGGMPVVRGTRVPVHDVAASVAAGISKERILAAYPSLDPTMLELAVMYANANPLRGRPRTTPPPGAVVFVDRIAARRGRALEAPDR